ncbi:MAG: alcohol dehydrogenase catalytic domain-containing protein [Thermodesulfovibrionales bacterium]
MIASFLVQPGVIETREIPCPEPSRGEVLIKVKAALTCGTDLKAFLRGHPLIPMPGVFGHEFSGIIAAAGGGVRAFKEGDAVMAVHSAPCRACHYCRKKLYHLCERLMSTKVLGAFAEYLLLPAPVVKQNLFHKHPNLSFEEAAFLEPLSCVVHGIRGLPLTRGDRVLIIGTGPIGLLHCALATPKGAQILMSGRNPEKLRFSRQFGADGTASPAEMKEAARSFTGGMGFDYVFECTGQVEVWEHAPDYARRGGTVVLFGGCKGGTTVTYDTCRLHYDEITVKGAFHFTPQDVRAAYSLLKDTIDVSPLISGTYQLSDLPEAFEKLSKGEGIKYAVLP